MGMRKLGANGLGFRRCWAGQGLSRQVDPTDRVTWDPREGADGQGRMLRKSPQRHEDIKKQEDFVSFTVFERILCFGVLVVGCGPQKGDF